MIHLGFIAFQNSILSSGYCIYMQVAYLYSALYASHMGMVTMVTKHILSLQNGEVLIKHNKDTN